MEEDDDDDEDDEGLTSAEGLIKLWVEAPSAGPG